MNFQVLSGVIKRTSFPVTESVRHLHLFMMFIKLRVVAFDAHISE